MSERRRMGFIGGGNMARALIGVLIRAGYDPKQISVSDALAPARDALAHDFSITTLVDNRQLAAECDLLVLAVKPQAARPVIEDISAVFQAGHQTVVSIMAGIRATTIERWLGGQCAVVRAMPNTPALIGSGATGVFANTRVDPQGRQLASELFEAVGIIRWVDEERDLDSVTALSGSGPAYFFYLAELLERAAVSQGLDPESARALCVQTAIGAAQMLRDSGESAAALRGRVTSPGGTTHAAIETFRANGIEGIVELALEAARARSAELGRQFDQKPQ